MRDTKVVWVEMATIWLRQSVVVWIPIRSSRYAVVVDCKVINNNNNLYYSI
jgi:hypothetical protein